MQTFITMCIYYTDKTGLTYISGEHIFPAAIGGIQKLLPGTVSDQFNYDISKLELDFIRKSFVGIARQVEGPGKRGKLADKYATKSPITVIQSLNEDSTFSLGYIKKGRLYEIPQVLLNTSTSEFSISFDSTTVSNMGQAIAEFKNRCADVENLRIKNIICELLTEHQILIGIEENIEENFNCFIATASEEITVSAEKIKAIGASLHYNGIPLQHKSYMPQSNGKAKFSFDYFRLYGKMAFNFLAFLKGSEFVLSKEFDPPRQWIVTGGDNKFASLNKDNYSPVKEIGINLPVACHYILIFKLENKLVASVYLYEALSVVIELHSNFTQNFSTDGFICDWKNRKEYRLFEYIAQKIVRD
ncbi:hypothetical protein [Ferruginibacter sp.]